MPVPSRGVGKDLGSTGAARTPSWHKRYLINNQQLNLHDSRKYAAAVTDSIERRRPNKSPTLSECLLPSPEYPPHECRAWHSVRCGSCTRAVNRAARAYSRRLWPSRYEHRSRNWRGCGAVEKRVSRPYFRSSLSRFWAAAPR